jgi:hypothetical protein
MEDSQSRCGAQTIMARAEQIASCIADCVSDLVSMACAGEHDDLRVAVWGMLATQIAFRCGRGDCFVLPPLDDC